jgi:hypothetical protein
MLRGASGGSCELVQALCDELPGGGELLADCGEQLRRLGRGNVFVLRDTCCLVDEGLQVEEDG